MGGRFLATELSFRGPIPDDIDKAGVRGKTIQWYDPLEARERETEQPLDNNALLRHILKNSDIDILLKTLGNSFFPQVVSVGVEPTVLIEPQRYPKGYVLINPNTTVSGVATSVTMFGVGTVFPLGDTFSAPVNVSGHGGAAFFLNVTEASASTEFDLQSQDPLTGAWATVQANIFSSASGLGTYYANVGSVGIDQTMRLQARVVGDTLTGSVSVLLKPALAGTVAGPTIFLGGQDVNTAIGFPLLSGSRETFYLRENTALFAVAVAPTNVNLFQLQ